jgi:hypothetical protein
MPPLDRIVKEHITLWDGTEHLTADNTTLAAELEAKGWRPWYAEIFGQSFVDTLDSEETDDKHHSQAIEWHWNTRRALIRIELEHQSGIP